MESPATPLPLDKASVTEPARRALGRATAEVTDWQCTLLHGGYSGAGVYRVAGHAHDHGTVVAWVLVLKVVDAPRPDSPVPVVSEYLAPEETLAPWGTNYWKRDALAYQSGLLADLPAPVVAPRCFGTVEQTNGTTWLWLEEVTAPSPAPWSLPECRRVAYHLGCFNGAYLTGRPLPLSPWLCSGGLRRWLHRAVPAMVQLPTLLDHPLVQRLCPPTVAPRLLRLWDNRDLLLGVLDRLPQTFGHHDVWRPNAVLRAQAGGGEQLVLLDWGFAGTGALGHDPGHLAGSLIGAPDITLRHAQDLDHQVFDGYTAGLQEAGWQGNTATVRLGYTAALAVRSLFSNLPLFLGAALREDHHAFWEQTFGAPLGDVFDMTSRPFAFFLERGDEAQTLAARF